MRWYVEPLAVEQRRFNEATLKLTDELFRRAAELDERATRLERRLPGPDGSQTARTTPWPAAALPDYFEFETRMRGSTADIRARQVCYVDDFREAISVLDVGCGRGEFLGLLRDARIPARGVDRDPRMVAHCRAQGLDVELEDVLNYLERVGDGSLGGVFSAQVVEHMPPPVLIRFLELTAAKLRPGGLLVAETINPLSPIAMRHYFADLTHAQPLVPETLVFLAHQAGFQETKVRFLNEPDQADRLRPVSLPADPMFDTAGAALSFNTERLNALLFGSQDYALIART